MRSTHIKITSSSALVLLLFSGCATPGSGIVEIAPDTYMHSSFGSFTTYSGGEVKAKLYSEANTFCSSKGGKLTPLNSSAKDAEIASYASAEIQFRCTQ